MTTVSWLGARRARGSWVGRLEAASALRQRPQDPGCDGAVTFVLLVVPAHARPNRAQAKITV